MAAFQRRLHFIPFFQLPQPYFTAPKYMTPRIASDASQGNLSH